MHKIKLISKFFVILFLFSFTQMLMAQSGPDANAKFHLKAYKKDHELLLRWTIAPEHFLYKERIHFSTGTKDIVIAPSEWPKSHIHKDRMGLTHQIYKDKLEIHLPLPKASVNLNISFQGCSLKGICYPPQQKNIKIEPTNSSASKTWIELLSFFGIGLLMAFTPCVLPMLPIMTRIVIGQHQTQTFLQTFGLAFSYVLGMASSYALVGGLIAMLGKNLFIIMQQKWIMITLASIFIYFALATLGILEIKLPIKFQQKTLHYRATLSPGRYLSALLMGGLSLLVLSPCVTAPLLGALTYITQMGQVWKGSAALFSLGLGMGVPLMIFAISAGHYLPHAGSWMENIKQVLALLLFGMATLLLSRTLKHPYDNLIWLLPLGISIVFFRPQSSHQRYSYILRALFCAAVIGYSIYHIFNTFKTEKHHAKAHQHWVVNTPRALDKLLSQQSSQPVMLYFSAKWCTTCQYLDHKVWNNQSLVPLLNQVRFIKIDLTDNLIEQNQLMQQYQVVAPPTVILLHPEKKSTNCRLLGEDITVSHLQHWTSVLSKAWSNTACN